MAKIRFTKNELKIQRDALRRFNRYLPMLQLKKQQLQVEVGRVDNLMAELNKQIEFLKEKAYLWVDVFAEDVNLDSLIKIRRINTEIENIAGIEIPLFISVDFQREDYDYFATPLWVDSAIEVLSEMIQLKARLVILKRQKDVLKEELRITTQRVNLFEKVKIPTATENIRLIQIHLGELETANVVRGKIAKAKIEQRRELVSV